MSKKLYDLLSAIIFAISLVVVPVYPRYGDSGSYNWGLIFDAFNSVNIEAFIAQISATFLILFAYRQYKFSSK